MNAPVDPPGKTGSRDIATLAQAAELAAQAEEWDRAIDLYRNWLLIDQACQRAKDKLARALEMRDVEAHYRQGRAWLATGRYREALVALRQARRVFSGHYKDTDALIVEAQTAMQKHDWQTRSQTSLASRGCFLFGGMFALVALFLALSACSSPSPAASTVSTGNAGKLAPQQRSEMYKSAPPMTIDVNKSYVATIKTAKGNIVGELYPKDAPQTVNNFVFLARDGFFNGLTFHRVVSGFVIQGGDPLGTGLGGPGYNVPPEIKGKHSKGAMAMARVSGPPQTTPSSGSQFYITLDAQPSLDNQYTVFGQVTQGMDIVQKIAVGDVIQSVTIEEK